MKGHQHPQSSSPLLPPPPSKRRCSGLAAAVPALVVCSTLLPLVYLLVLHRPAGACVRPRLGSVVSPSLFLADPLTNRARRVACSVLLLAAGYGSDDRAAVVISTVSFATLPVRKFLWSNYILLSED